MLASELFDELKNRHNLTSDVELAKLLGITGGRISQLRSDKNDLSVKLIFSFFKKSSEKAVALALESAIRPAVEMYPIEAVPSKQNAKWELLPTDDDHKTNKAIRKYLESIKGIYIFYDSLGCAIYAGKTAQQNIWKELTSAFNRARANHKAFFVKHPTTGDSFKPAWEQPRQPVEKVVYLHDTAHYFSAYEVAREQIPKIEAFVVRAFCNSLSNKKMEKF